MKITHIDGLLLRIPGRFILLLGRFLLVFFQLFELVHI
jgi:hypothetical protein